jgi:hypothetical protein
VLKAGEQQLKVWENEKGFYTALASVIKESGIDPSVRWMAITYIKNGVERYWRPGAPNGITDEEKAVIRSTLLQCLEEPVQQVSTQLAVLMARIARLDCPERWPDLLPHLTKGVQSANPLLQKCSLNAMKHVIKTLAGRRLAPQRKAFYAITMSLFVYLAKLWTTYLQESLSQLSSAEWLDSALLSLEMSRTCLKILRQMIVHGFPKFHAVLEALQFLHQVLERVLVFLQLRSQLPSEHTTAYSLEQNITLMMKTLLDVQAHHPIGFVSFLTPSLQLVYTSLIEPAHEGQLYERFVIQSLNLLRQIVQCEDYSLPTNLRLSESSPPPQVIEAQQAKLNFFKASTCQAIMERLICHFMPLSGQELQRWEDDPEEFAQEKAGEMHQYSLRACVETMYVCLLHEYQQTLMPSILTLIRNVQSTNASAEFDSLRLKEAVYKAAGLGAFQLYDEVDFDNWYQTQLISELEIHEPRYKIVRHRVVWLIGNWATVKLSSSLLPSIYSTLLSVLQPCEDLVIRLTAADSLKMVVDDFEFSAEEFSPHLADSVHLLVQLLCDVRQADTKLRVLLVLSLLMERMGHHIQPHVPALLHCLPSLWEDSTQENSSLLRVGILTTLTNIVRGLGALSVQLHDFILPVVHLATNVKSPDHVYLIEEGLDLWVSIIHHSTAVSGPLLALITNIAGLLGLVTNESTSTTNFSADNLDVCFCVLDSYCVLCASQPDQFIQSCAEVVMQSCKSYISEVKSESAAGIVKILEHVVQYYPSHFPALLPPILPTVLTNLLEEETHPPTVSGYLSLLARILLQNSPFFFSFLEQMATRAQQTVSTAYSAHTYIPHELTS